MKIQTLKRVPLLVAVLLLAGCDSNPIKESEEGAPIIEAGGETGAPAEESEGASTTGAREGGGASLSPLENPDSPLFTKNIYFDLDRSEVPAMYRAVVVAHGEYLAINPAVTVLVEGHCDERGSREYNIGLGERRANAVRQLLIAQGASSSQITTISYGEERPVALGSDESAWSQNRRAVFVY